MRRILGLFSVLIVAIAALVPVPARAQQPVGVYVPPDGLYVTTADSLRLSGDSDWEIDANANLHNGSKLITNALGGVGEWASGMGISGTSITTGTITAVSAQPGQILTTGNTNTSTTLTGIPTFQCSQVSATMGVTITSTGTGSGDLPANNYTTSACGVAGGNAAGAVTINAAATGTHTGLTFGFVPAALMSNNALADTVETSMVLTYATTLQLSANCDVITGGALSPSSITAITLNPATTHPTTLSAQTTAIASEGWLRNCTVSVSAGNPGPGSTFAKLEVIRSSTVRKVLTSGSITAIDNLSYPGGPLDPVGKTCRLMIIGSGKPAAGVGSMTIPVPSGVSWEMISGAFELQAGSTVSARVLTFSIVPREGVYGFVTADRASWQGFNETGLYVFTQSPTTVTLDAGFGLIAAAQIPSLPLIGGAGASYQFTAGSVLDSGSVALPATDQLAEFQGNYKVCLVPY